MGKIPLFHESDQEEEEQIGFQTNKSYAKHYDEFRRKEVLGQCESTFWILDYADNKFY